MNAELAFFDTNVLVYAAARDDRRTELAGRLLANGGIVSVQILNELVAVAIGKMRMSWDDVFESLTAFRIILPPARTLTLETHDSAVAIARRYGFHIYDSLIIAAAVQASCTVLYTEDLHDGQVIEGLTIRNPFL